MNKMSKLTENQLKEKMSKKLTESGVAVDEEAAFEVLKTVREGEHPETPENGFILDSLKSAGILRRRRVSLYTLEKDFDKKPEPAEVKE